MSWTEYVQQATPANPGVPPPPSVEAKTPWYKRKLLWVGAVVLSIAVASGGSEDTDPAASNGSTANFTGESPSEEESTEPDAVKVDAGAMLDEFDGNEAAADAIYGGQVVEVTGHVAKVDTEFWDDDQYVVQLDGGDTFAILSVNCNDLSAEEAAGVQSDSTVTVRGTFDDGGDLGVELADCEVL